MAENKLVIRVAAPEKLSSNMVRVSHENHTELLRLKRRTGLSIDKLLSLILDFAMDKIEIIEE